MNPTVDEGCIVPAPWLPNGLSLSNLPLIILQIQLLIVFVLTQALHCLIFKHLGLPPLVSQLVAGILLSPTVFIGRFTVADGIHEWIFPSISEEVWKTLATLGYVLTLFLVAVKMDFSMIRKNGRKPFVIGLLVLIVPSIVNMITARAYGHATHINGNKVQMRDLTMTAALVTLTPFPVIAILLSDMKLLNSELGRLALSSAIVSEVGSIISTVFSKAQALFVSKHDKKAVLLDFFGITGFLLSTIFILRPIMNHIIRQTPRGRPVRTVYILFAFLLTLVGGLITEVSGEFIMMGCFIVGAAIPDGPPLGSAIVHKFESFVLDMLLPFFITVTTMRADVFKLGLGSKLGYGKLLVTLIAFLTKIIICIACGWFYNMAIQDSLTLAAIMSSKGILDIAAYNMFNESQMIQDSSFTYLIIVATMIAIIVPVSIRQLYHPLRKYAGYMKRDVMHCKAGSPLRILACISRKDNVSAITNLISISRTMEESPIIVDVLHLIKLVGRSQPIFISHDMQQKKISNVSYSEDVIWALKLRTINRTIKGLSMHYYTAISPPTAMHEDICTLALDNLTSLIILPFHRKLNIHGSIDYEDHMQRALNISVLKRAPCSVGIFADRGSSNFMARPDQTGFVGVFYIGGKDDQEALAYAKRIARGQRVKVVVTRLVALGKEQEGLSLMDCAALSGIQEYANYANSNFKYTEVVVKDGAETVKLLRSAVGDFDLIIVGRRYKNDCTQTSGLQEWSEVPEIGILGDILASPDLQCRTSILIVQQQRQWTANEKIDYNESFSIRSI